MREAVSVLMESAPSHLDPSKIRAQLRELAGVTDVHDLHIWTVSSGRLALSVHLIGQGEDLLAAANRLLQDTFGIVHTTIQVEHPDRFQSERCYDCQSS